MVMTREPDSAVAQFTLQAGEHAEFVFGNDDDPQVQHIATERCFRDTVDYWRRWSSHSSYRGRWREMVTRSALALCSPRTSTAQLRLLPPGLPEELGGERWDYRASWIRDASFSMYALMRLGYVEEARDFTHWVGRCVEHSHDDTPHLQVMYRLDSGTELHETELLNLSGYANSRPVRIGNDAASDAAGYLWRADGCGLPCQYGEAISQRGWRHVSSMIDYVCVNWNQPDAGIWEMRGEPEHCIRA